MICSDLWPRSSAMSIRYPGLTPAGCCIDSMTISSQPGNRSRAVTSQTNSFQSRRGLDRSRLVRDQEWSSSWSMSPLAMSSDELAWTNSLPGLPVSWSVLVLGLPSLVAPETYLSSLEVDAFPDSSLGTCGPAYGVTYPPRPVRREHHQCHERKLGWHSDTGAPVEWFHGKASACLVVSSGSPRRSTHITPPTRAWSWRYSPPAR